MYPWIAVKSSSLTPVISTMGNQVQVDFSTLQKVGNTNNITKSAVMQRAVASMGTGEAQHAGSVLNGSAVASSTGWGDGTYPVYATILDDRVLKWEIQFA